MTPTPSAPRMKKLHDERRAAKICINQPNEGDPHGPVVGRGRCQVCLDDVRRADEAYRKTPRFRQLRNRRDALRVSCSSCGAPAGQDCVVIAEAGKGKVRAPHRERIREGRRPR
jgi:hypothetical protein